MTYHVLVRCLLTDITHHLHVALWHVGISGELRNKAALAGFARSSRGQQSDVQVTLFHYSEQEKLDTKVLEAQVSSSGACEVSVLLLATASSSYLWFDAEHCPRNVELCTILRGFPELRVNFIVCPTTESARVAWQQHPPDLESVFGEFLPETGKVDLWTHFDPEAELESQQICSLVCRSPNPASSIHQNARQQMHRWSWQNAWPFLLVVVAWQQWQIQTLQGRFDKLEANYELQAKKVSKLDSSMESHANNTSDLASTCESQGKKIGELASASELQGIRIEVLEASSKSQANNMSDLASTCESQGKKIGELASTSEFQGIRIEVLEASNRSQANNMSDLASTCESQGKKIGELASTSELQGIRIEVLEASSKSQANNMSDLASTCESQGKKIGELASTSELEGIRIEVLEASSKSQANNMSDLASTCESQGKKIEELDGARSQTELGWRLNAELLMWSILSVCTLLWSSKLRTWLCHWRDQATEMQGYLLKLAGVKTASGGAVVFPYVAASLKQELQFAMMSRKKIALTDRAFAVTNNYKLSFPLLYQLLEKLSMNGYARVGFHCISCCHCRNLCCIMSVHGVCGGRCSLCRLCHGNIPEVKQTVSVSQELSFKY